MKNSESEKQLLSLCQAIRSERKARGLSQTELGKLAGVGINFISQVEAGKPTAQIGKVLAVLQTLGLEIKLRRPGSPLLLQARESD